MFAALSARVGSIADNRLGGWHAYRASKAALNMLVKNLALELARTHPQAIAVTLHPGKVNTGLSAPFQRGVVAEKLFAPAFSAAALLGVLDGLTPADSGGLFAWDGARVPFCAATAHHCAGRTRLDVDCAVQNCRITSRNRSP